MVSIIVNPGDKYGRLEIIAEVAPRFYGKNVRCFLCRCLCGKEVEVVLPSLRSGNTVSCGCSHIENSSERFRKYNPSQITHGLSKHPLYNVRKNMIDRCYNSENAAFENYGGRGISVCSEWRESLPEFVRWAENNGYSQGLEIDRIDNEGNYEPSNCRFVDAFVNANNKRNNVFLTIFGEKLVLTEAVRRYSVVSIDNVRNRLQMGWSDEDALLTPLGCSRGFR